MSIASAIQTKQQQVAAAYSACNNKGATMPAQANQNLTNLADTIGTIQSGGGGDVVKHKVYWFDYDGTVLKEDEVVDGGSSTAPSVPSHQYLRFEEWVHGNTLTNITHDYFNIARHSCTENGIIRKVNITDLQDYTLYVYHNKTNNDPVVIDWGDGTTETITSGTTANSSHRYANNFSGYVKAYSTSNTSINSGSYQGNIEKGVEELYFGNYSTIAGNTPAVGYKNLWFKALVLPNGLTALPGGLFCHYTPKVLAVPLTVSTFGNSSSGYRALAFDFSTTRPDGYSNIIAINIPANTTTFLGEYFFNIWTIQFITRELYVTSFGSRCFAGLRCEGDIIFKSTVTSVGSGGTFYSSRFRKIDFSNTSITTLGYYGNGFFNGCWAQEIILPTNTSQITSIAASTFDGCSRLKTIKNFPKGATTIGNIAFQNCSALETPIEFTNVTSLGNGVFTGCSSITSVKIGGTFTSLNKYANGTFYNCSSLREVQLPDTVTTFGEEAFNGCYSLSSITFPTALTTLAVLALTNIGLTSLSIPNSVSVNYFNLDWAPWLRTLYIGLGVTFSDTTTVLNNCPNLNEVDCADGWIPNRNLPFSSNDGTITHDSMVSFFTHLGDNTGGTARTLTFGARNLDKLTAAEKAIATDKNYVLA